MQQNKLIYSEATHNDSIYCHVIHLSRHSFFYISLQEYAFHADIDILILAELTRALVDDPQVFGRPGTWLPEHCGGRLDLTVRFMVTQLRHLPTSIRRITLGILQ